MILLAIDYGTKRIGLATGDTETGMAFPLRTLTGGDLGESITGVLAAARTESAERIVVGVPRRLDGGAVPGDMEQLVSRFVEALRAATTLTIDTEDERLSSALADRLHQEAGGKKNTYDRDAMAAAMILESYLTRLFPHANLP